MKRLQLEHLEPKMNRQFPPPPAVAGPYRPSQAAAERFRAAPFEAPDGTAHGGGAAGRGVRVCVPWWEKRSVVRLGIWSWVWRKFWETCGV